MNGVRIFINPDLVKAIAPLYANTALTKFRRCQGHEYKEIPLAVAGRP